MSACGNPKCGCSTGIHEGLTFGSGKLDVHGYWEHPCRVCAADWDAHIEEHKSSTIADLQRWFSNDPKRIETYMADADWLKLRAWPYAKEEVAT